MRDVAQWITVTVAVVLFLGAVVVYLRGSKDKGTIATLEANNDALKERVDILEKSRADDATAKVALHGRVQALERERDVLVGIANSREAIAELSTLVVEMMGQLNMALGDHHKTAMSNMATLHKDLTKLISATGGSSE